ncbi:MULTISPECIES: N-acetylglucosamine-6-phosphate deacetylase [Kordiimonas]|jgi:N-acetylglucosamine-6-phosphate deacetylase|uniref:N-acetylglucosamine-6-phosphate deacetylase n=1 Tax=Kordiimonas TaxID=288021 RepID=UPI00257D0BCA|nr:N-acetylglucosamine-6-phosphate deacetylase [Kordiimonas sp. UBA4487]
MRTALKGGDILVSNLWHKGATALIEDGRILAVLKPGEPFDTDEVFDITGHKLVPGFIDTQVNGGGGVLLNDAPTVEGIRKIAEAHRAYGTTSMLPTLISDDLNVVAQAIEAVDAAIEVGVPGIIGIHIEGPFLSGARKGIHDADKFRTLDADAVKLLSSLKFGKTLVTLAPECTTPDMVRRLVGAGVIVAAGHTAASYEETMAAIKAGLTGFTHLHNAMTPMTSRAPGVVGAALDSRMTFAGIIADGFHVHGASLRTALYAKGADQLMLVTDAMPSVGAKEKNFTLQGLPITVENGRCTGPDGTLAGSDLDMASAVRNAVALMGVPLDTASRMASRSPARFLGLEHEIGDIRAGMRADLCVLDGEDQVTEVWIGGERHTGVAHKG